MGSRKRLIKEVLGTAWSPLMTQNPCSSPQRVNVQFNKGEHGFDNQDKDMKTIFRAVGPSFKSGIEVEPFESVHVYELMCQLLGIVPEPNDGHPGTLQPMLQSGEAGPPLLWGPSWHVQAQNQATVHTPRGLLREAWGFVEIAGVPGPPEACGVEMHPLHLSLGLLSFLGSALPLTGQLCLMMMLLGILTVLAKT